MAVSKVIYGGETLIDLTKDTVKEDKLLKGYTAHGADGEKITGTCEYDSNTQDANAVEAEILKDKTAYVRGNKVTGTMPNNGAVEGEISTKDGKYNIPIGYHDGSGKVGIADSEVTKLIPENIKQGITILGVKGTMTGGGDLNAQSKTVTPSVQAQEVLPDSGYNALASVTVLAIPYTESENSAGGKTVTIG
jgi:hypothetical protein